MEENDLISKKELLQMTGISYGQLYRWKRENLIPETWFIKKSSYTGQETFFPKDKILKRTSSILELKDKNSLEELRNMFSPETTNRIFRLEDFGGIAVIKNDIVEIFAQVFQKDNFNFIELTFIYLVAKLNSENEFKLDQLKNIVYSIQKWIPEIKNTAYSFLVFENETGIFTLLVQQEAQVLMDYKTKELKKVLLDETAKELQAKLNEILEGGI